MAHRGFALGETPDNVWLAIVPSGISLVRTRLGVGQVPEAPADAVPELEVILRHPERRAILPDRPNGSVSMGRLP